MIRGVKSLLLLAAISMLLAACHSDALTSLPADRYKAFVADPESQLNTIISAGIWKYRLQYNPAAYIALKERSDTSGTSVKARIAELKKTVWFNVSISVADAGQDPLKYHASISEYNTRLAYFLTEAQRNFHLYYGTSGEMKQIAYHFENYFNLKPEVTAVIGFSIPDDLPKEDLEFVYEDGLFNAGILKFKLFQAQLAAVPQLSI
jgi:hypothetical protein